ncbi:MAG: APC family permease [Ilumatobacteraceae bacterium]
MPVGKATVAKRLLIGRPIASTEEGHQRLKKRIALPVFASDAISSTAYATDEILVVLLIQAGIGAAAWSKLVPLAIIVAVLLVIVVISYRQTIYAYPSGGGSYVVSRENLGRTPSLVAGASLLTDYILTVAVSVAGGVLAIQSAFGFDSQWRVPLCLLMIVVMTVANLRGLKESGAVFAPPTYLYIVMLMLLIVVGCYKIFVQHLGPIPLDELSTEGQELAEGVKALSILMLLRAFSSGAVALSGVEAVSNGVPAFEKPESRNAAATIAIMGGILGTCFLGVSVLASHLHPYRGEEDATGIAIMAEYIYGGKGLLFWVTQLATFAILILAANTAYADFPRLSSIIARDGFLPRQLANRGDRLVFSNGIIFLAVMAGILIVVFKGNISALIPLYAFGVFTGFTLSQAGMVVHHYRLREPRWRASAVVNAVGCVATGIVAIVVVVSKFTEGAWIPAVLIPLLVVGFRAIGKHYRRVRKAVAVTTDYKPPRRTHLVVVLVGTVNRGVIDAVTYARSLAPDRLLAVSVIADPEEEHALVDAWSDHEIRIPLHTIASPYRDLTGPILEYLDELDAENPDDLITVVIPEFVTHWRQQWLHNQSALALKARLLYRPNTVVTSIPVIVDEVDSEGEWRGTETVAYDIRDSPD